MVLVGALLAASTGMVGATAVTMGLIMLPAMLRHGYDPRLAAGTVAASATLAQIIPPSTVLVLLGDQLNNAYQSAQLAKGTFAPNVISVSDLFAGAIMPGSAAGRALSCFPHRHGAVAAGDRHRRSPPMRRAPAGLFEALLAPVVLIVAVLGSILGGIATPTEAASVGAVGAMLLAARKVRACAAAAAGRRKDHADHVHDLSHPHRRHHVQPRVPRARRRRAWCSAR